MAPFQGPRGVNLYCPGLTPLGCASFGPSGLLFSFD